MQGQEERNYSERQLMLGVPDAERVMELALEDRLKLSAEIAGYLTLLPAQDVLAASERVVGLYSHSATVLARFDYKAVDVYAVGAAEVLETMDGPDASRSLHHMRHARRMVEAQRFAFVRSQNPQPAVDSLLAIC